MKKIILLLVNTLAITIIATVFGVLFISYMYLPIDKLEIANPMAEIALRLLITIMSAAFAALYLIASFKLIKNLTWKLS
jgi:uncharacterized membrane protein (DUF2068 family)